MDDRVLPPQVGSPEAGLPQAGLPQIVLPQDGHLNLATPYGHSNLATLHGHPNPATYYHGGFVSQSCTNLIMNSRKCGIFANMFNNLAYLSYQGSHVLCT